MERASIMQKPKQERPSFLKKRSKKLLRILFRAGGALGAQEKKFFGSFFQKRTYFLTAP
jgi:hypothetical protein